MPLHPTANSRSTNVDTIIAAVRALGRYGPEHGDEDHDRAATYPCNMTFADIDGGSITIYSGPYGPKDGYLTSTAGERSPLDIVTMETILRLLDDGGFPCYDSNELA